MDILKSLKELVNALEKKPDLVLKKFNEEEIRRYGKNKPQRELVKILAPGEEKDSK